MIPKISRADPVLISFSPPSSSSPKGLLQGCDTLSPAVPHKKPPLLKRAAMSFGLFFVHSFTLGYRALCWIGDAVTGPCRQKKLYKQLKEAAQSGDPERLRNFLQKNTHHNHIAGFMMRELLAMPDLHAHLAEILDGANVRLLGDEGFFCEIWSKHPKTHQRVSSHRYQGSHCYELHHLSFWLDLEGNTRFQFQSSPLKGGLRNFIEHTLAFLRYKRDNKQRGVTGASPRTEEHCLSLPIDPQDYLKERQKNI